MPMKTITKAGSDLKTVLGHLLKDVVAPKKMAKDLDVSYSTIRSWSKGRRKPKTVTIREIQRLYGVKII